MEETENDPASLAYLQWASTQPEPIDPAEAFTVGWRMAIGRFAAPVSDDPISL